MLATVLIVLVIALLPAENIVHVGSAVIDTPFSVSMISIYRKKNIADISIYRYIDEN